MAVQKDVLKQHIPMSPRSLQVIPITPSRPPGSTHTRRSVAHIYPKLLALALFPGAGGRAFLEKVVGSAGGSIPGRRLSARSQACSEQLWGGISRKGDYQGIGNKAREEHESNGEASPVQSL